MQRTKPNYFESVFGLDLRSLALFRICIGLLIIADLAFRWSTLVEMYSGDGFFTRNLSFQFFDNHLGPNWAQSVWSLYWISDSVWFVRCLFALAALSAFFLIVGKWTRTATVISWLLLASLHVRNPLVISSGDFLFKMILFWSIFLPLGARWSLDAGKKNDESLTFYSIASVGYIIQMFAMYFFSGIAKWNDVWLRGEAMSYVLRLDIYIRELGKKMLEYPDLLAFTSWATLAAEILLIWTLFVRWKNDQWRLLCMTVFCVFHIGIAATLAIGMFPWICIIAWLPLLPSSIWSRSRAERPTLTSNFNWNQLSTGKLVVEIFVAVALMLVLVWNVSNIEWTATKKLRTPLIKQVVHQLMLDQHFQMFGVPPTENPWFVYDAKIIGGQQVDIWRDAELDESRPESGLDVFPNFHWRKLHRNALHPQHAFIRQPLLDRAVETWNLSKPADQAVAQARLICFREEIGPEYNHQNHFSHTWATYKDENAGAGSLFDSLLHGKDNPSF